MGGEINKDMNGRIGETANRRLCHVSQLHPDCLSRNTRKKPGQSFLILQTKNYLLWKAKEGSFSYI